MRNETVNTFLAKLIDWKDFEFFVSELYKSSEEVIVRHNVIEIGKSNAKRQIDVLVLQKTKLHFLKIIVECKFWKSKVDRGVIDILAAAIDDLNASKGVIFTTKGYEEGAIQYAKSKNIDLFIVRDVYENEWGSPGRHILLYLQSFNGKIEAESIEGSKFISTTGRLPNNNSLHINLYFSKDMELNDAYTLYSFPDLKRGPNLAKLIADVRSEILKKRVDDFNYLLQPQDGEPEIAFETPVKINFQNYKFNHLKIDEGYVTFDYLNLTFFQSLTQNKMEFDRAASADFVLIVENYITNQRNFISKAREETNINLSDPIEDTQTLDSEKVVNGSIIKVMMDYYVNFVLKPSTVVNKTKQITVNLQTPAE